MLANVVNVYVYGEITALKVFNSLLLLIRVYSWLFQQEDDNQERDEIENADYQRKTCKEEEDDDEWIYIRLRILA